MDSFANNWKSGVHIPNVEKVNCTFARNPCGLTRCPLSSGCMRSCKRKVSNLSHKGRNMKKDDANRSMSSNRTLPRITVKLQDG